MMVSNKIKKQVVLIIMIIYLWWWSTNIDHVKAQSDSLKPGDTLNVSSFLYSKQNKYYLHFDDYSDNQNDYMYLSIFSVKKNVSVWIYDRYHPINSDSPILSLDYSGVLKIEFQRRKLPVIIYSSPKPMNNNVVATMLDTGNFVVQMINSNGTKNRVLWQSFDYPLDTLLPTMKLGVNRKTGYNWSLVSWFTPWVPGAAGSFSLEWEPIEGELNIKKHGKVYWKSGKLKENGMFENILEDVQRVYRYKIVSNNDEDSFSFEIKDLNYEMFPGWILIAYGKLSSMEGTVGNADMCYGYNIDEGCQKWDIPTCREYGDFFQIKSGSPSLDNYTILDNVMYSYSDCKTSCWRNCSCTGFVELYDNGTGCIFFSWNSTKGLYYEDASNFFALVKPTKIAPTVAPTVAPKVTRHGKKRWMWISVVIAATLLIIITFIICLTIKTQKYRLKEKKSERNEKEMQDLAAYKESNEIKDIEDDLKGHDINVFSYISILEATMNFSIENKLGQGGYGPVYKGILPEGKEVAVKRLSNTSGQGIVEFKNELELICELQHTNLVQLLGCCIHKEERILIYEYMPNKSLDFYLFDSTKRRFLDWKKRFNIIEGISQGLLYLHKYSRLKIIHRDLKASNILLDENMNPKISDFGMARMFNNQESTVNTNRIVGTYGYMSPEYAMEGICSTKSDVYSFGVLLLEIISGRKNNSFYDADRPLNLIGHAWELWNDGEYLQLLDPSLSDTFVDDEVKRCIHVGLLCVEQYANDRPTMSDVISMLTNKYELTTLPKKPAFYVRRESIEEDITSKGPNIDTYSTTAISTSSEVEGKIIISN